MCKEKCFAVRLAGFTAVGMSLAVGVPTFVDSRMTSNRIFGAREYPMGYWILLIGPLVFVGMYYLLIASSSVKKRIVKPIAYLLIVGCLSLLNFFPEFPNGNVILWLLLYFIGDVLCLWTHYTPIKSDYIDLVDILDIAKIEMIKESINFWRTSTLMVGVGYLAILVPWSNLIWTWPAKFLTNPKEEALGIMVCETQLLFFSFFFLFCPVLEGIRKWQEATELFRKIKKPVISNKSEVK
jgi:hypothetical protein